MQFLQDLFLFFIAKKMVKLFLKIMNQKISHRSYSIIIGSSYWIIFFAAVFGNFFALEALKNDPLRTVEKSSLMVRIGIFAFLITVVFDVVVAWALNEMFKENYLNTLSTLFRMMHAVIMALAVFALPQVFEVDAAEEILKLIKVFDTIWLIGLFFFGIHLLLLAKNIGRPKVIAVFLAIAGCMYMVDTLAHFGLENYDSYKDIFLALVAIPSIIGEMSLAVWFLLKGGKEEVQ